MMVTSVSTAKSKVQVYSTKAPPLASSRTARPVECYNQLSNMVSRFHKPMAWSDEESMYMNESQWESLDECRMFCHSTLNVFLRGDHVWVSGMATMSAYGDMLEIGRAHV